MKRRWTTTIKGEGSTPSEALANLLEDRYAMCITGAIYIHPKHSPTIETLALAEDERPILGWEAQTTVTLLGELEEDH